MRYGRIGGLRAAVVGDSISSITALFQFLGLWTPRFGILFFIRAGSPSIFLVAHDYETGCADNVDWYTMKLRSGLTGCEVSHLDLTTKALAIIISIFLSTPMLVLLVRL